MKKIMCLLFLSIFIAVFNITGVFAFDNMINIREASYDALSGEITVKALILNPAEIKNVTIMASGYDENNLYSTSDIVYINSFLPSISEDNSFSFSFKPAGWFGEENRAYVLRMRANGINKADYMIIYLDEEENISGIYFGDVDKNNVIDENDVNLIMSYVLNSDFKLDFEELKRADIIADGSINATDAVAVFKAINKENGGE